MATFKVLTGSALGKAITGFEKTVSTFKEREHQLAYSALNHVELHNDAKYLNALLAVTPANYKAGLVAWSKAFGKVKFDATSKQFELAKDKKSDLEAAMAVAPADYVRAESAGDKPVAALMDRVEKLAKKAIEDDKATAADKAFAKALGNFLAMHKRSLIKPVAAAPANAKVIKAKAKPVKEAAPVAKAA